MQVTKVHNIPKTGIIKFRDLTQYTKHHTVDPVTSRMLPGLLTTAESTSLTTSGEGPADISGGSGDIQLPACMSMDLQAGSEESLGPLWDELEAHDSTNPSGYGDDAGHFEVETVESGPESRADGMNLRHPLLIDILSDIQTSTAGEPELEGNAITTRGAPTGRKRHTIDLHST